MPLSKEKKEAYYTRLQVLLEKYTKCFVVEVRPAPPLLSSSPLTLSRSIMSALNSSTRPVSLSAALLRF
jgi:hypothetical protein